LYQWEKDGTMKAVYDKTYQKIWDAQPAALIPWFRDHMPEVLEKTKYSLDIKDYIRFCLTGELCGEITAASSGALMNIETKQYDQELFRILGIEKYWGITPPFVNSTSVSGRVTKEAEKITGLREGTPVSGGYFDIDAGALGSGVMNEDVLCLIAGTWSINEYITADIKGSYGKFSNTVGYLPGYYVVEDSSPTSASNFNWFVERFLMTENPNLTTKQVYRECDRIVSEMKPEESELVFVPYLYASASNPLSRGAFLGMSGFHEKKHFIQAVYEGVVFSSVYHVKRLTKNRRPYGLGRLSGGVANSRVWSQMMCDALNLPIETLTISEQSALGAAISAGIACGLFADEQSAVSKMVHVKERFEPDPERVDIYKGKFDRYCDAVKALDYYHGKNMEYVDFLG
jgi:L-xylulokinase